jgi:hypothetical protein
MTSETEIQSGGPEMPPANPAKSEQGEVEETRAASGEDAATTFEPNAAAYAGEAKAGASDLSEQVREGAPFGDAQAQDGDALVYDSEARQRIPVTLWQDAGRLDVTLICEPVSDTTLIHYARMVTAANAEDADEEVEDAARRFGGLNRAGCWLFDVLMSGVEGVGEEGEELPDDWRDRLFGPLEKAEVINRAILGVEFVAPRPAPQPARPSWAAQSRAVVNRFRVPFNARMVDVSHTLSRPDAARLGEFMARQVEMRSSGSPGANMENFACGYDALHVSHAGYRGDPPLHHKAFAYAAHLNRVTAGLRKN